MGLLNFTTIVKKCVRRENVIRDAGDELTAFIFICGRSSGDFETMEAAFRELTF